jgi:hypothetical protein
MKKEKKGKEQRETSKKSRFKSTSINNHSIDRIPV